MVEVTQADREAAWPYRDIRYLPDRQTRERWFAGYYDKLPEGVAIQAFARHRQSAADYWYRQGKDDGHEAAVRAMVKWLQSDAWDGVVIEHAVDAIEAGEPFK